MKVLHLTSQFLPWVNGGTEIFCFNLCQQLQKLNVNNQVAFHSFNTEPIGTHSYGGIAVEVLPSIPDSRKRTALYTRATVNPVGFSQLIEQYQPDIVHFHNFSVSQGITHLRLSKRAGCKLVLTYHTPTVSCPQHGLLYRSQSVCDGRLSLHRCSECRLVGAGLPPRLATLAARGTIPLLNSNDSSPLVRLLTTRQMTAVFKDSWQDLLEQVDAIHVLAAWAKEVVELNGAPPQKVHLIRTGGPDPVPSPGVRSSKDNCLHLAFIGRSTSIKGMHVLVEAVQQLPKDLPVRVTFFCANYEWEQKAYGQQLQQKLEADDRFELKYNIPNHQLLPMLADFDLCVVPSLWLETGPLVVLEAFAAGVPVLGSRLGGIAELVSDGVDGLLFEPGNSNELASLIKNLINDPTKLKYLRKNVHPPRRMADVAADVFALYQKL